MELGSSNCDQSGGYLIDRKSYASLGNFCDRRSEIFDRLVYLCEYYSTHGNFLWPRLEKIWKLCQFGRDKRRVPQSQRSNNEYLHIVQWKCKLSDKHFFSISMIIWHIFGMTFMRHCLCLVECGTPAIYDTTTKQLMKWSIQVNLFSLIILYFPTYPIVKADIGWWYKSLCIRGDHPQAQSAPQCQRDPHDSLGNSRYAIYFLR